MKRRLILGNWKMNLTLPEADYLLERILENTKDLDVSTKVGVCVPFVFLQNVSKILKNKNIDFGSQDVSAHKEGAFTGDIGASMLKEFNPKYSLVGHSERRQYQKETDEIVANKVKRLHEFNITPVLCVGESEKERDAGKTLTVIKKQIQKVIDINSIESFKKIVIAYEPVWAIGTGKTATAKEAQEVHAFIRDIFKNTLFHTSLNILYGGSMNAKNAKDLLAQDDIDGGLIGGASLKADDFLAIIKA